MRYVGQGWEIPVDLTEEQAADPRADVLQDLFEADYTTLFGRIVHGLDIEVAGWAVNATTQVRAAEPVEDWVAGERVDPGQTRPLFDPSRAEMQTAKVTERNAMQPGQSLSGPAIVTERETTIIVPDGFVARMRSDLCVEMIKQQSEART